MAIELANVIRSAMVTGFARWIGISRFAILVRNPFSGRESSLFSTPLVVLVKPMVSTKQGTLEGCKSMVTVLCDVSKAESGCGCGQGDDEDTDETHRGDVRGLSLRGNLSKVWILYNLICKLNRCAINASLTDWCEFGRK